MEKAKVYFTDFRTVPFGDGLPAKLKKLIKKAGIDQIDMDGKFVAIKMHFGELGNISYLRPNYARAVVDVVKELGGKPFLTDCNTLYPGKRKNALEHLECAWENGFTPLTVGCPILIGDGLKGTDDIAVPVKGGQYVKEAKIGRAIMDADVFISLSHFKGHELTGFRGAIKNIGMGCGSRAGKKEQHSNGKARISQHKCRGCLRCLKECANNALVFDTVSKKMTVNKENCVGCGRCLGSCNFDAISFDNDAAVEQLNRRMAEYAKAVLDGRPNFHISLVVDVSPYCDCHGENDVPILPDLGMFASFDPLALDQACVEWYYYISDGEKCVRVDEIIIFFSKDLNHIFLFANSDQNFNDEEYFSCAMNLVHDMMDGNGELIDFKFEYILVPEALDDNKKQEFISEKKEELKNKYLRK